ncbi:MAG TPA: SMP-30/gluconolactonase/LRE family protein [Pseudonocardia sp.]|uniref:SMP-30/gluconolactonase/LRE family protein n=1 Tax=Pseudonocardia sp. TaxID=60912 RepID=UPI002BA35EEE|nr:SMP-30/gluconolactonase/LRE family protein [Pseudonocardia sp.]HTF46482.1 SMP-30/gluconolactonase/LRE family protein [Pseudonocardia sp.]
MGAILEAGPQTSRYEMYRDVRPICVQGWQLDTVHSPARTFGSCGIQFEPNGRLWITELVGNQISSWDPRTDRLRIESGLDSPIHTPDDVAFDSAGNAYITTMHDGNVMGIRPGGEVFTAAEERPENNGVTVGPSGRIFVDQMRPGGQLVEIYRDPARKPRVILPELDWANALEQGPDGRVYLQHFFDGYVLAVDPDSGEAERVAEGFDLISAVRFDPRGRLVVLESGSGAVTAVDLSTGQRSRLATSVQGLDNCAFDAAGHLYVSHYVSGRIVRYEAGVDRVDKVISEGGLVGPYGMAYRDSAAIVCADFMSVVRVGLDGSSLPLSHLANHPYIVGIARLGESSYAGLSEGGEVFDLDLSRIVSGPLSSDLPAASALGPAGPRTAVLGTPTGEALTIGSGGRVLATVPTGLAKVGAVAAEQDTLVAADPDAGQVMIRAAGQVHTVSGRWRPAAVVVHEGQVYVADEIGRAVERISPGGAREVVVSGLPIGFPVEGKRTTARRPSLLSVPGHGLLVGCDGDGSIRRLSAAG